MEREYYELRASLYTALAEDLERWGVACAETIDAAHDGPAWLESMEITGALESLRTRCEAIAQRAQARARGETLA